MRGLKLVIFLTILLQPVWVVAVNDSVKERCPEVKLQLERMPDLNIPRAGHQMFLVNGELVAAGGHTNGFIPTPTAEYYKDGEWHLMQMVYNHDVGFSVVLSNGKVLLGGGCEQSIGIGQTYLAEMYDPVSHSFNGFGSMETKRTWASALEIDNGQVVISGNWYHDDGIEVFDGQKHFTYIKKPTVARSHPFILRTSKDDALIFGRIGVRNDTVSCVADCLKGDSVHIPLFDTWHPMLLGASRCAESFIGDEAEGLYSYLIPVIDDMGQVAIAKVENGAFSLLPTVCPVPMTSQGDSIEYFTPVIADRQAGCAYIVGLDRSFREVPDMPSRYYVLRIDYAKALAGQSAPLTLYYTDSLETISEIPILDSDGNMIMAGGYIGLSNFTPSGAVWLFRLGKEPSAPQTSSSLWLMVLLILAALLLVCACAYLYIIKKKRQKLGGLVLDPEQNNTIYSPDSCPPDSDNMIARINQVMETQKLYQNSNLKVTDLAAAIGTNRRSVSECINSQRGCTFTQFVNIYRVDHAKRVLLQNPNKKITDIYIESGFANEGSFFRTFKAVTGMTPKEWLSQS